MAETTDTSSTVKRTDATDSSTKPADSLRPYYYTTFQNNCCESKTISSTSTQNKDFLPIPNKIKIEAEEMLNPIHSVLIENLTKVTGFTSIIPNIFFEINDTFHVQRYLIDRGMFKIMKDAHIINWNLSLKQLYPIRTSGNGNCLLHAVLIAMIGIHDSNLYLRDRLAQFMDENKDILKNHWRIERLKSDKIYGISSEDSKLDDEWDELCNLVHYERSEDGQTATYLQFLEAVHIFCISNMLRRPIIVLSEDIIRNKNGEAISVNDLFGIYLPILSQPRECVNEPIVLAYDHSHFCPLQTNDSPNEKTADNLLPLYLSINHMYDQALLPVRFLGDDVSADRSDNLLHDYLRIRKVEYSLDSNSSPISILCAELGDRYVSLQDNFFLLYHKYLIDFFEVQKPKAIEEERKRERQRELENYAPRPISYDTNGRPLISRDPLSSDLPSITSSRSYTPIDGISSRNQNRPSYEEQYLNDDRGYIPYNGTFDIENRSTQPRQSNRSPDYAKLAQLNSDVGHSHHDPTKQSYYTTYPDNISNLRNNGKSINTLNSDRQDYDINPTREGRAIEIPVQRITSNTSLNNQNLFISEQERDTTTRCLLCNRLFHDTQLKRFCPRCDHDTGYSTSGDVVSGRSQSRSQPTNLYLSGYNSSNYTNGLPPVLKTTAQRRVTCPHCKSPNLLTNWSSNSGHFCSVCQNPMFSSYNY